MLVAGGAALAPIILHMWRRRPQRIVFPAVQFIREGHQQVQRKLRLRELLLLVLRVFALLALTLGLARPIVGPGGPTPSTSAPRRLVLIVDNSVRMDYVDGRSSRLERAKEIAERFISRLPLGCSIAVVDCQGGPIGFEADRAGAIAKLRRIRAVSGALPVAAAALRGCELLVSDGEGVGEVTVVSDLTTPGWPSETIAALRQVLSTHPGIRLSIVDVGAEESANLQFGDLQVLPEIAAPGDTVYVRTLLAGSISGSFTVELYLRYHGARMEEEAFSPQTVRTRGDTLAQACGEKRGMQTVSLDAGSKAEIQFGFPVQRMGFYQGCVALAHPDPLEWDNRRYFTVMVRPAEPVLLVAPNEVEERTLYIRLMLEPEELTKFGLGRFRCEIVGQSQLATVDFSGFSVVALVDPQPIEEAAAQRLYEYVLQGGGLLILLGAQAEDPRSWQGDVVTKLLPATPLRQARAPDGIVLRPESFQHPILQSLEPYAGNLPWDLAPVFRYWQLSQFGSDVYTVISFSDGQPALVEKNIGQGRVLLFTTPFSDPPREGSWNWFTAGECWPLLAVVQQLFLYLSQKELLQLQLWSSPRLIGRLPKDPVGTPRLITVAGVPAGEFVLLEHKGRVVEIPGTHLVGNYRLEFTSDGARDFYGFSVNIRQADTDLRHCGKEVRAALSSERVEVVPSLDELSVAKEWRASGRELSGYFLIAAALFFLAELVVANRFYGDAEKASPRP